MPRLNGGIALAVCAFVAGSTVRTAWSEPASDPALSRRCAANKTVAAKDDDDNSEKTDKKTKGEPTPAKPSEAPLPSCLDQTIRGQLAEQMKPRGVQKRDFRKDNKLVLLAHGGLYGGDLTSSSWFAGGSLGYWFTEDVGIAGEFDLVPLTLDLDAPLDKFFGDNRFTPAMAYVALGHVLWSPIHAKLKLGGGIVHADFMFYVGGGRMIHDAVQGISFDGGMALDLFVTRALTIRLDARNLMAVQEAAGETRYTNNLVATVGLALYIPTGL